MLWQATGSQCAEPASIRRTLSGPADVDKLGAARRPGKLIGEADTMPVSSRTGSSGTDLTRHPDRISSRRQRNLRREVAARPPLPVDHTKCRRSRDDEAREGRKTVALLEDADYDRSPPSSLTELARHSIPFAAGGTVVCPRAGFGTGRAGRTHVARNPSLRHAPVHNRFLKARSATKLACAQATRCVLNKRDIRGPYRQTPGLRPDLPALENR